MSVKPHPCRDSAQSKSKEIQINISTAFQQEPVDDEFRTQRPEPVAISLKSLPGQLGVVSNTGGIFWWNNKQRTLASCELYSNAASLEIRLMGSSTGSQPL